MSGASVMRPRYMGKVLQFCGAGRGLKRATSSFGRRWQQREGETDKVSQVEGFVFCGGGGDLAEVIGFDGRADATAA